MFYARSFVFTNSIIPKLSKNHSKSITSYHTNNLSTNFKAVTCFGIGETGNLTY